MSQSRKITEPSPSWFLSWPKSPTFICWVCFGFHHLLPFILFWLGLIWTFETGFHSVQGVALNLQFSCFWRLCVGMTGVCCLAQPYFWLLIQEYECVCHTRREAFTKIFWKTIYWTASTPEKSTVSQYLNMSESTQFAIRHEGHNAVLNMRSGGLLCELLNPLV